MTNLTQLANELMEKTAWQRTPEIMHQEDYERMIVAGLKTLYIDTGRASLFNKNKLVSEETENFDTVLYYEDDLPIDEEKYVMLVAQIEFFKQVQTDVNNIVGYTTDALTVTNADKPYAHLQGTIDNLENERRIVFYKMTAYSFYQG